VHGEHVELVPARHADKVEADLCRGEAEHAQQEGGGADLGPAEPRRPPPAGLVHSNRERVGVAGDAPRQEHGGHQKRHAQDPKRHRAGAGREFSAARALIHLRQVYNGIVHRVDQNAHGRLRTHGEPELEPARPLELVLGLEPGEPVHQPEPDGQDRGNDGNHPEGYREADDPIRRRRQLDALEPRTVVPAVARALDVAASGARDCDGGAGITLGAEGALNAVAVIPLAAIAGSRVRSAHAAIAGAQDSSDWLGNDECYHSKED
jgi:hypothetical protein